MSGLHYASAGATHRGLVREHNEDAFIARPERGLWAVADGMGGHAAGDVAAQAVVDELATVAGGADGVLPRDAIDAAIDRAQRRMAEAATGDRSVGAAVAVLAATDSRFTVAWAGDSRVYRLRDGRLERLTHDHSVVQDWIDRGELSVEQARRHPRRSQLTRAIVSSEASDLDHGEGDLRDGDRFLVCSDGLTGHVDDDRIAVALGQNGLEAAVRLLIDATLADGARDNVTVVVVEVFRGDEPTVPGAG